MIDNKKKSIKIKMLDLFSGIGGFHKGFERAGFKFDWVGFSEIDKYASAVYKHKFKEAEELGDITTIQPERDLPNHIDLICGGFPCQAFSVAGKRKGFDDTRGTLFFEIARILRHYRDVGKPISCFLLENVKGLLSHDNGRTFATIYRVLDNLGYTIEFQLLNTRWWLPQNRERIYLVGYLGDGSGSKVFPFGKTSATNGSKVKLNQIGTIGNDSEATRVYDIKGNSRTLTDGGGMGAKTGLYQVDTLERNQDSYDFNSRVYSDKGIAKTLAGDGGNNDNKTGLYQVGELKVIAKKRSYDTPKIINEYLKENKNGKTIREIAESLDLPKTQIEHYFRSDKSRAIPSPDHWLLLKKLLGFDDTFDKEVTDIYEKEVEFESSRRVYSSNGISKTLDTNESGYYQVQPVLTPNCAETSQDQHGVMIKSIRSAGNKDGSRYYYEDDVTQTIAANPTSDNKPMVNNPSIRRLTPKECERLQGFPDDWTRKGVMDGKVVDMSDTQRYKQCGNAVTVDVVQAVAERICPLINKIMSN